LLVLLILPGFTRVRAWFFLRGAARRGRSVARRVRRMTACRLRQITHFDISLTVVGRKFSDAFPKFSWDKQMKPIGISGPSR
jgi:hypothetical protein